MFKNILIISLILAALYPHLAQRLAPATLAALYAVIGAAACLVFYFARRYPSKVYDSPVALSSLERYQQRTWKERLFGKQDTPDTVGATADMYGPENDFLAVLKYKMQCLPEPGETPRETVLTAGAPGQDGNGESGRGNSVHQKELMPGGQKPGDTVDSCLAAGFSARSQGDYAGALSLFLKALGLNPAPNAALNLALEISSIYMAMGQYPQARMILWATLARNLPGDAPLQQGLRERLAYIECLIDLLAQAKLANIPYFQVPEAIIREAQKNIPQENC